MSDLFYFYSYANLKQFWPSPLQIVNVFYGRLLSRQKQSILKKQGFHNGFKSGLENNSYFAFSREISSIFINIWVSERKLKNTKGKEIVFCLENCSDLLWEKIVLEIETKTFEIQGWTPRICKLITRTIYSNS